MPARNRVGAHDVNHHPHPRSEQGDQTGMSSWSQAPYGAIGSVQPNNNGCGGVHGHMQYARSAQLRTRALHCFSTLINLL